MEDYKLKTLVVLNWFQSSSKAISQVSLNHIPQILTNNLNVKLIISSIGCCDDDVTSQHPQIIRFTYCTHFITYHNSFTLSYEIFYHITSHEKQLTVMSYSLNVKLYDVWNHTVCDLIFTIDVHWDLSVPNTLPFSRPSLRHSLFHSIHS